MRKRKQQKMRSKAGSGHGTSRSVVEEEEIGPPESGGAEYERERLLRIEENRARMEALGLPTMAASFARNWRDEIGDKGEANHRGRGEEDDDDYKPNLDGEDEDSDELSSSSLGFEDEDDDEDYVKGGRSKARSSVKKARAKKKVSVQKQKVVKNLDFMDEDEALKMAIAFSLEDSGLGCETVNGSEVKGHSPQLTGKKKGRKSITSRVQLNEDDVVIHFCQFDEAGRGSITVRDLERMALSHDFTWTDKELMAMIRCFDADGDGKLTLEDFRNIVARCNMLQASENV